MVDLRNFPFYTDLFDVNLVIWIQSKIHTSIFWKIKNEFPRIHKIFVGILLRKLMI